MSDDLPRSSWASRTDPSAARGQTAGHTSGRSPVDRLRGVGSSAPGNEASGPTEAAADDAPADVAPQPDSPPPAVIAVGERPRPYDPGAPSGDAVVPAGEEKQHKHRKQGSFLKELPILIAIAVVLAVLIKTFLVQAFFIPSPSMTQTLHVHDRVLVNKLAFHTGSPQRGEIVVFDTTGLQFSKSGGDYEQCPPSNPLVRGARAVGRFVGISTCGEDDFIKRIIAVPGDTIMEGQGGPIILNGHALAEPYTYEDNHMAFCQASYEASQRPEGYNASGSQCGAGAKPITVPKDMYWVMGDHRSASDDSRYNGFVPRSKLVGRAFMRILPPNRIGFLHVPGSFKGVGATTAGVAATPVLSVPALLLPIGAGRSLVRRRRRRAGRGAV